MTVGGRCGTPNRRNRWRKIVLRFDGERTPGFKLLMAIGVAFLLTIPLVSIYLLNYDRQSQSREATSSITAGWGSAQAVTGPLLVIPWGPKRVRLSPNTGGSDAAPLDRNLEPQSR